MSGRSHGTLVLLKPPGMTSHDVVDVVRRRLGRRRVGHTGTLDPLAAGVLVLLVGRATRTARYFTGLGKRYRVEAVFGLRTASGDADGPVLAAQPARGLSSGRLRREAAALTGRIRQRPPATSAVRVGGRRLYERYRRGERVEAPPRTVRIDHFALLEHVDGEWPRALFDVQCGSGTYVRSLVEDLGRRLGTGAVAAFLLRTAVGPFALPSAHTLEELDRACRGGAPPLLPLGEALAFLPAAAVPAAAARRVAHGQAVPLQPPEAVAPGHPFRIIDERGRLLAVARLEDADGGELRLRYEAVLARPEEAG